MASEPSEILEVQKAAHDAIDSRMRGALAAGAHTEGEWRSEPYMQHLLRASKHLLTAIEVVERLRRNDPESAQEHVSAAICRASMGLAVMGRNNVR